MTLNYKAHDVLKTSGAVVKIGEYQGANFDENGKPVSSKFGGRDIKWMHDNATEPIPIYVDLHGQGLTNRELAGYCFRLGMNSDGTELAHNGFVFSSEAQKRIASGYNQISPEITTMKDANGNIVDRRIDSICFVPSGAMGNELNYMVEKFSTIEGMAGQTNGATGATPTVDVNAIASAAAKAAIEAMTPITKAMIDEAVLKVGQNTQNPAEISQPAGQTPPSTADIDPKFKAEFEQLKIQAAAQQQFADKLINEKYDDIVAQVKKLGIPDPSGIVAGLSKSQAIEALSSVKANLIQTATLNGVPSGLGSQGMGQQKSEAQAFDECMVDLGFNSEHYREMFK